MKTISPGESWTRHEYDVDAVEILQRIGRAFSGYQSSQLTAKRSAYVKSFREWIYTYGRYNELPPKEVNRRIQLGLPIIISSSEPAFEYTLAISLIFYDPNKLDRFLDYQKEKYNGRNDFSKWIEHRIYDIAKRANPIKANPNVHSGSSQKDE